MIRVHVEAAKNTNSVMGRIRVETMKASIPGKASFYAGFRKAVDMFPRTNGLRRTGQKADKFR